MISLKKLTVEGFRSLDHAQVTFGDFTVLVGPNGSGKSNLLKALAFVRDSTRFDISQAVNLAGGFDHVIRQDGATREVKFHLEGNITEHASNQAADSYILKLTPDGQNLDRAETFRYKRVAGAGRRLTMTAKGSTVNVTGGDGRATRPVLELSSGDVSALGTTARVNEEDLGPGPREFFGFLSDIRYFDPDANQARRAARISRTHLDDAGTNLAGALWTLAEEDSDAFELLKIDLRRCLPGLLDIHFETVGGSTASIVVRLVERGVTAPIDLADASFGTVRMLALLVALHEPTPPRLTIIEEVDHGLHPYALDVLVERMRAASVRTQIIVASHSPTLVNRLSAGEIIICDRNPETGASIIPAREPHEVSAALSASDHGLGELWFAGILGGVPQ